jgi:hypothetical protein
MFSSSLCQEWTRTFGDNFELSLTRWHCPVVCARNIQPLSAFRMCSFADLRVSPRSYHFASDWRSNIRNQNRFLNWGIPRLYATLYISRRSIPKFDTKVEKRCISCLWAKICESPKSSATRFTTCTLNTPDCVWKGDSRTLSSAIRGSRILFITSEGSRRVSISAITC